MPKLQPTNCTWRNQRGGHRCSSSIRATLTRRLEDGEFVTLVQIAGSRGRPSSQRRQRAQQSRSLLKGTDEATLLAAVRSVAAGAGTLDHRLTRRVLREFGRRRQEAPAVGPAPGDVDLTAREREVLQLLARRSSNAEIAETLFVELTTVKYHLAGLLQKTGSRDRLQAVLWGIRSGLVTVT